jgi:hypothetical protein
MYQIILNDGPHKYVCESPDKATVLAFMSIYLEDCGTQTKEIKLFYRQTTEPINTVQEMS